MNRTFYLLDNNALIALGRPRIRTKFFAEHCRVTSDVLHEARENPERRLLKALAEPVTPAILEQLRLVMTNVEVGDIGLINLYGNKGAADPGLVAIALHRSAAQDGQLFPDTWTIVTLDQAVIGAARSHDVPTMAPAQLADRIDASSPTDSHG